jgi:glycerophosphoryl diester phosphodiesterase
MAGNSWLTSRPIAHRGLHDMNRACWENTLTAFQRATDAGYAIECDVHLSSDGVPVVIHDAEMQRLTGKTGHVWERTAKELGAIAIGGTSDRVPTLADLLETVDGRVPLVIELKGTEGKDAGLVAAVAEQRGRYRGEAAIISFDHCLVREFHTQAPEITAGLTACGKADRELEQHYAMLAYPISFVSFAWVDLPNRFVAFIRDRLNMPVITWTVRDEQGFEATRRYADQITFEGFDPSLVG